MIHVENSQALLDDAIPNDMVRDLLEGPEGNCETVGYCRTGGGMYGQRNFDFLKPCITLKAQIRHTHIAPKGAPIGYDRSWVAPEDVKIATLAIGFADGYPRACSNAGSYGVAANIGVHGQHCQIAGKVCMDMMMV